MASLFYMSLNSKIARLVEQDDPNDIWSDPNIVGAYEVATSVGRATLQRIQFQDWNKASGRNGVEASDVIEILIHKLSQDGNRAAVGALLNALSHVKD